MKGWVFYKANVLIENSFPDHPTWELVMISPEKAKRLEGEDYGQHMSRLEKLVYAAVDEAFANEELMPGLKYIGVTSIEEIHNTINVI